MDEEWHQCRGIYIHMCGKCGEPIQKCGEQQIRELERVVTEDSTMTMNIELSRIFWRLHQSLVVSLGHLVPCPLLVLS
ncbi:hypothetical protein C8Q75DRAFT_259270 [Abortiporus biennis]|nr:hypothetical protein C8Q75DRAFT_259270 [Abortiporus biennis]